MINIYESECHLLEFDLICIITMYSRSEVLLS